MSSVFANVGAEVGDWRQYSDEPAVAAVAQTFEWVVQNWERLRAPDRFTAWLNTTEALREAERSGLELFGTDPEILSPLVSKAWALEAAIELDLVPEPLIGCTFVLSPELLSDEEAAMARIAEGVAAWPAWARESYTLKPCIGTSARGRVAGTARGSDTAYIRGALPRLREAGGALVEPWCARIRDLSAQFFVAPDGELECMGVLHQITMPSGQLLGLRGPHAAGTLVEAATKLVAHAVSAGFRGVCGVDAFVFEHQGQEFLRPVVELNPRFTVGTLAIAAEEIKGTTGAFELRLDGVEPDGARPLDVPGIAFYSRAHD